MELRVLRYFLAVAREESISRAAEKLHITQPTLSRQLMELETELDTRLFDRSRQSRSISLTRDGYRFLHRAEEIVALADRTAAEFRAEADILEGDLYLGMSETVSMQFITQTVHRLHEQYPRLRFHLQDGNERDVSEQLASGLLDFGVFVGNADISQFETIQFPLSEHWGLVMHRDHPLAQKDSVAPEDFIGLPLIMSQQELLHDKFTDWLGFEVEKLSIVVTFNLAYNAFLLAEEQTGCVLCLNPPDRIREPLCFRPLSPALDAHFYFVWKKNRQLSRPARLFLSEFRQVIAASEA